MILKWQKNSENEMCLRFSEGNTERNVCVIKCIDGKYLLDGRIGKSVWYNHPLKENTLEEAKAEVKKIYVNRLTESLQECLNQTKIYSDMLAFLA